MSGALMLAGAIALLPAGAQEGEDLAKQLANPAAALISVRFQANWDQGQGADDAGSVFRLNVQPVVPISLNGDWNLISRTILPVVNQRDVPVSGADAFGLGDIVQSLFFSPVAPVGGWILGVGPVLQLPTATEGALGTDSWGVGPTAVALRQSGPWTVGALVNHIESVAGGGAVQFTLLFPE